MSEKKIRITKAQRFEDIKNILNNEPPVYGTTVPVAVEVIDHELELLAKKNSGDNKKLTQAQKENENLKELILEFLAGIPEDSAGITCTEIYKGIPALTDFSNQKVSALMRQLKQADRVKSCEVKGKTLFSLT